MVQPSTLPSAQLRRSLRIVTLLYFLMYAGTGIYFTYFAVFLRSMGMSGTQIGLINMAGGIISFFASTFWGYLSDRTGRPSRLLAIASAGAAVSAFFFPHVNGFWGYLLLGSIYPFFNVAILTLMDSNLLALLGENRGDYGRYRLGGTFGYILTTLLIGFLLRGASLSLMFPLYSAVALIFSLTALTLPALPTAANPLRRSKGSLLSIVRSPAWLTFILSVFLVWIAGSGGISFLGVTLKSMGASDILVGVVAAAAAVFEIPFMIFNSWFLRKLGSRRMFFFSLIGYVLRIGGYSLMPSPIWGIAVNAFNGISYVWMWNASIVYANEEAPPELKATAQGLFISATALSGVVSAPLSGWLFDAIGPLPMYRVLAAIALSAVFIFGVGSFDVLGAIRRKLLPAVVVEENK